jgi:dTDP-4-dehydrorhamnose 3,5-epimerase-like enzyme
MPKMISLQTKEDNRGKLTLVEKILPFEVKRIFFIYDVPEKQVRGGHKHRKTIQALFCVKGQCQITIDDGYTQTSYQLHHPNQGIILWPEDWHEMSHFSADSILMVLASEEYDPADYILDKMSHSTYSKEKPSTVI